MPVGLHGWRPQTTQRHSRVDMRVAARRCELGSRSPLVRVQLVIPDLVEPTPKRGAAVGVAAIVRLETGHRQSLYPADCELMRQIKDGLLAPLRRRVVSFNLTCSALSSNGPRFNLSVQTWQPLDGGAHLVSEARLPLKQPN